MALFGMKQETDPSCRNRRTLSGESIPLLDFFLELTYCSRLRLGNCSWGFPLPPSLPPLGLGLGHDLRYLTLVCARQFDLSVLSRRYYDGGEEITSPESCMADTLQLTPTAIPYATRGSLEWPGPDARWEVSWRSAQPAPPLVPSWVVRLASSGLGCSLGHGVVPTGELGGVADGSAAGGRVPRHPGPKTGTRVSEQLRRAKVRLPGSLSWPSGRS